MESVKESSNDTARGPFTATKLWNEVVLQLKSSVQVKRRRWRMKVYFDAFTGCEAVDRLHECLKENPNFGPSVSRQQSHQLCQKFLDNAVIEDVRGKEFNSEFEDSNHLYRFVSVRHSPYKATRSRRRKLTVTVGKEISSVMSALFSKDVDKELADKEDRLDALPGRETPSSTFAVVQGNPCSNVQSNCVCPVSMQSQLCERDSAVVQTQVCTTTRSHSSADTGEFNMVNCSKNKQQYPSRTCQIDGSENASAGVERKSRVKLVKATPMKRGFSRLITTPFTPAPSRTPLVNKLNVLGSVKSESKLHAPKKRQKLQRRSLIGQVITNSLTMEDQKACRNLSEKEIEQIWQDVAVMRVKRLLEMEESDRYFNIISCSGTNWVLMNFQQLRVCRAHEVLPQWVVNAMKCLLKWSNEHKSESLTHLPSYCGFERDVFRAIVEYFDSLTETLVHQQILPLFLKTAGFIIQCKLTAMRALQYCCLLLNPCNRQILQVLLRFMIRLSQNHNLILSDDLPTRELVIQSFSKCVFGVTGDMDVIRVLFFMMENFPAYFKNPEGLQYQVEQRVIFLKNCRGNEFTAGRPSVGPVAFCEQVTRQEYEEQTKITSQRALKDLLNQIVDDETINERDRNKKLRKFQKSYPDLYSAKFPGDNVSTCSQKSVRLKQVMKPLTILTSMR